MPRKQKQITTLDLKKQQVELLKENARLITDGKRKTKIIHAINHENEKLQLEKTKMYDENNIFRKRLSDKEEENQLLREINDKHHKESIRIDKEYKRACNDMYNAYMDGKQIKSVDLTDDEIIHMIEDGKKISRKEEAMLQHLEQKYNLRDIEENILEEEILV